MNVIHLPQKEQQKAVILKEDPEEIALSDKNFYFYKNFMIKKDGFWMSFILISIVIIILTIDTLINKDYEFLYYGCVMAFYFTYKFIAEHFSFIKNKK